MQGPRLTVDDVRWCYLRTSAEEQDVDHTQARMRSPVTGCVQSVFSHNEPSPKTNRLWAALHQVR
jgi:hypothetical protein